MANKIKNLYKGLNKNNGKDKNSLLFELLLYYSFSYCSCNNYRSFKSYYKK